MTHRSTRFALTALTVSLAAGAARASLIAYEPFDAADGTSLDGTTGGIGFSGGWVALNQPSAVPFVFEADSGSVPTITNVVSTGNSADLEAVDATRDLAATVDPGDGTIWASAVLNRAGTDGNFYGLEFQLDGTNVFTVASSLGSTGNEWSLNNDDALSTGVDSVNNEVFALFRVDFSSTADDTVYLWVFDGVAPTTEPLTADAVSATGGDLSFNEVQLLLGNTIDPGIGEADEIRIATTFDEALTAVPEPASLLLMGLGGLLMMKRPASA